MPLVDMDIKISVIHSLVLICKYGSVEKNGVLVTLEALAVCFQALIQTPPIGF